MDLDIIDKALDNHAKKYDVHKEKEPNVHIKEEKK